MLSHALDDAKVARCVLDTGEDSVGGAPGAGQRGEGQEVRAGRGSGAGADWASGLGPSSGMHGDCWLEADPTDMDIGMGVGTGAQGIDGEGHMGGTWSEPGSGVLQESGRGSAAQLRCHSHTAGSGVTAGQGAATPHDGMSLVRNGGRVQGNGAADGGFEAGRGAKGQRQARQQAAGAGAAWRELLQHHMALVAHAGMPVLSVEAQVRLRS